MCFRLTPVIISQSNFQRAGFLRGHYFQDIFEILPLFNNFSFCICFVLSSKGCLSVMICLACSFSKSCSFSHGLFLSCYNIKVKFRSLELIINRLPLKDVSCLKKGEGGNFRNNYWAIIIHSFLHLIPLI